MGIEFLMIFLLGAVPPFFWIIGQVMEHRIGKKGFKDRENEEAKTSNNVIIFISGLLYLAGMVTIGLGVFISDLLQWGGVLCFIIGFILSKKAGVMETLTEG